METLKSLNLKISQLILMVLGLSVFLSSLVYGGGGIIFTLFTVGIIFLFEYFFRFFKVKNIFNPYLLMILTPLLLLKFSSIIDFRIRIFCFFLFIYIFNIAYYKSIRKIKISLISSRPFMVWFIAFVIFALVAMIFWLQGIHLSGDEPHYLMMTQSFVEDGDFDLKNNFEDKEYLAYIPIEVKFHGGDYNGKYLSFHLPGVAYLMIPFYWIFKLLGGVIPPALYFRLAAACINAFFALFLFFILKKKFPDKDITGFWLLTLLTFPLVIHSIHLYPELPAATLFMAAYYFAFFKRKNYFLAGVCLSLIPWFHVKYIPALLVLTMVIFYQLFRQWKETSFKDVGAHVFKFLIFPFISLLLLVLYCKFLYGSFSPTSVFPKESYWSVPWLLRLKVFIAYFLDQRDGLFFYSPIFFLFFFAFRKKIRHQFLLLGIVFIYVFFHAFTTVRGAYAPAGRPLIFISWIMIIFIAHFYFNYVRDMNLHFPRFIFRGLMGLGFFILAWLLYYPLFIYQPIFSWTQDRASGFNLFMGSDFIPFWDFFPSFLTHPPSFHWTNLIWIALLLLILVIYYIKSSHNRMQFSFKSLNVVIPLIFFLFFVYIYCFFPHVQLIKQNKYFSKVISFYNNSKNFHYVPDRDEFRIKAGNNYDIYIDGQLTRRDKLMFRFDNMDINDVRVRSGRKLLYKSDASKMKNKYFTIDLSTLSQLKVKNKKVLHLGFETYTQKRNSFLWLKIE